MLPEQPLTLPDMYQHKPLDSSKKQIRLLKLHAGEGDQKISCTVKHVSLLEEQRYETVSYVWGDGTDRVEILVDDLLLMVPRSSAAVLRRIRHAACERRLWIDAICIDQSDYAERNAQVSMMGDIYSLSKRTWIELGDVAPGFAKAGIRGVKLVLKEMRAKSNNFKNLKRVLYGANGEFLYANQGFTDPLDMNALKTLLSSPWFRRLWVMQEAALTQQATCMYGEMTIDLLDVLRACIWLVHKRLWLSVDVQDTPAYVIGHQLWDYVDAEHGLYGRKRRNGASVATALTFANEFNSRNDKDRVFGVLGLMHCTRRPTIVSHLLTTDYNKSVLEIYRDATRYALGEMYDGLDSVLSLVRPTTMQEAQRTDWLSWVPHWQHKWDEVVHPARLGFFFKATKDSRHYRDGITVTQNLDVLSLKGVVVNTMKQCSSILSNSGDSENTLHWLGEVQSLADAYDQHASSEVLLGGVNADIQPATADDYAGSADFLSFVRRQEKYPPSVVNLELSTDSCTRQASRWSQAFINVCPNRRFFITLDNLLGLGPKIMEPEDVVVILYGCDTPYVLRKWGAYWKMLGQAYVHGIMYGEALDEHHASGKPDEIFEIR